jgi:hypothetical protein
VPVELVGQESTQQRADAAASRADETVDAHRLRPVIGFGEQVHDQRQCDCIDDRAAESLQRARANEDKLRVRESAQQRSQREQRKADQEQASMSVQVAETAAEQQKSAGSQQIGVDHPGQRARGKPEVLANRRQRDVHDRDIEHDHQHAEAQHSQCEPAPAVARTV